MKNKRFGLPTPQEEKDDDHEYFCMSSESEDEIDELEGRDTGVDLPQYNCEFKTMVGQHYDAQSTNAQVKTQAQADVNHIDVHQQEAHFDWDAHAGHLNLQIEGQNPVPNPKANFKFKKFLQQKRDGEYDHDGWVYDKNKVEFNGPDIVYDNFTGYDTTYHISDSKMRNMNYTTLLAKSKEAEQANTGVKFSGGNVMGCVGEVTASAYNVFSNYSSGPSVVTGSTTASASLYSYDNQDDDEAMSKYGMTNEEEKAFHEAGRFLNPMSNYAVDNHEQVTHALLGNQTNEINAMIASGKYKDGTQVTAVSSVPLADGSSPGFTQFAYNANSQTSATAILDRFLSGPGANKPGSPGDDQINRMNKDFEKDQTAQADALLYPSHYMTKERTFKDRDADSIYRCGGNDRNNMDKNAAIELWHQHGVSKTNANFEQNAGVNTFYTTGLIAPSSGFLSYGYDGQNPRQAEEKPVVGKAVVKPEHVRQQPYQAWTQLQVQKPPNPSEPQNFGEYVRWMFTGSTGNEKDVDKM